jgi:hypothetical protein
MLSAHADKQIRIAFVHHKINRTNENFLPAS